jgi:hypothetical protein
MVPFPMFALTSQAFSAKHYRALVRKSRILLLDEASDQIPHGGSVFDSGYPIPFYSPGMLHVEC